MGAHNVTLTSIAGTYSGFSNTADSYHRIRLDYYNKAVGGVLELVWAGVTLPVRLIRRIA